MASDAAPAVPELLSTTGGPYAKESAEAKEAATSGIVVLQPLKAAGLKFSPQRFGEGAGWQDVISVGRHKDSDCVLHYEMASGIQCQVALRGFRLGDENSRIHEALFLRDLSEHGTFVNGQRAFVPWQWLQDKDKIGFPSAAGAVSDVFEVCYNCHHTLPGSAAQPGALPPPNEAPGRALADAPREAAASRQRAVGRPPKAPLEADASRQRTMGRPKASREAAAASLQRAVARPKGKATAKAKPLFDAKVVGRVIDLTYDDPPATYRVRIVSFDRKAGWHKVDSEGLSSWDGESFKDTVDLSTMRLKFVSALGDDAPLAVAPQPQSRKRARA